MIKTLFIVTNVKFGFIFKCNNLNYKDYKYLSGNDDPWFCLKCNSLLFPFGTLDNKRFMQHILNKSNMKNDNKIEFSNLVLKYPPSLISLFNQFNNIPHKHMIIKTLQML